MLLKINIVQESKNNATSHDILAWNQQTARSSVWAINVRHFYTTNNKTVNYVGCRVSTKFQF